MLKHNVIIGSACALAVTSSLLLGTIARAQSSSVSRWNGPLATVCATKTPITIDGVKGEGEWSSATVLGDFADADGLPAPRYAKAFATYDSEAIYLCIQSKSQILKAEYPNIKRDQLFVSDDAVEIFLQPSGAASNYYQLMVNPNGAIYDANVTDTKWDPQWLSKSVLAGDTWTVEAAIPFASLGVSAPADGDIWGFNICRDFKDPYALTTYAPMFGAYHSSSLFGRLRFAKNSAVLQMDTTGRLNGGEIHLSGGVFANTSQSATLRWEIKNLTSNQILLSDKMPMEIKPGVRYSFDKVVIPPVPISTTVPHTLKVSLDGSSGEGIYDQTIKFVPAEPLAIRLKPDYKNDKLRVDLDINGISSAMRAGLTGQACIIKDGKIVRDSVKSSEFKDAVGKITFQTKSMSDGDYLVRASVTDANGATIASKDTTFRMIVHPEWMNNSLGIDDNVPAPWTPLKTTNGSISYWNRTYTFGNSAFPKQIKIGEDELLTGPIELSRISDGKALNWNNSKSSIKHKGQSKITFSSSAKSAGVNLSATTTCEFDGFMRIDLTLSPDNGTKKIDKLVLRIPVDSKYAKYKYGYGNASGGGVGIHFPTEKDIVGALHTPWYSDFLPALWMGDTSHGIGWYCEGQKNWSQVFPENALSIESDGKSTVLQVNIVDSPAQLSGPITLSFGLQATPVKPFPRPKDWLTFRSVSCPGNKMFFEGWGGSTRWGGFPVVGDHTLPITDPKAFDDTEFKAEIASRHAQGLYLPMYLNAGTMALEIPEVQTYLEDWECTPAQLPTNDMSQAMAMACPQSKEWQDLFLYRMKDFYDKYDLDAIYMDFGFCQKCDNPNHGCGYTDKIGNRHGTWPIFALRDLHKRIYKILRTARPNSPIVTIGHSGGSQNLPHINFWDACVEGEYINVDIRGPVYNGDYTAFYSPERFATEFSGRTFSNIPLFMGYTVNNNNDQTRTMVAMALLNGSVVWPAWIDLSVINPVYEAMDRFGVSNIQEFLPYWDNHGAVKVDIKAGVYATVYKNKESSLVAVSNLSPNDLNANIQFNQEVLGLSNNLVVNDALSGESILVDKSGIVLPVKHKDFRLLLISN